MCDKSRNTWLCVDWQWNTLEWCQLNALQASPVVHLVTPLSCVSLSMNTQPSVPAIEPYHSLCFHCIAILLFKAQITLIHIYLMLVRNYNIVHIHVKFISEVANSYYSDAYLQTPFCFLDMFRRCKRPQCTHFLIKCILYCGETIWQAHRMWLYLFLCWNIIGS